MIRLVRDKAIMEVSTEVQASAFIKNGWSKIVDEPIKTTIESKNIQNQYNKTVINRMSTTELKEIALQNGINGVEDMTGTDLKKILIDKFNL